MCIAESNATRPHGPGPPDRAAVEAEPLADAFNGETAFVQRRCLIDFGDGHAVTPYLHACAVKMPGHRCPMDAERLSELVYGCAPLIGRHEPIDLRAGDLIGLELGRKQVRQHGDRGWFHR
jgi:hypothetical protein